MANEDTFSYWIISACFVFGSILEIIAIYALATSFFNEWRPLMVLQESFFEPLFNFWNFRNKTKGPGVVLKRIYGSAPKRSEYIGFYVGLEPALLIRSPVLAFKLLNGLAHNFPEVYNDKETPDSYKYVLLRNMCKSSRNSFKQLIDQLGSNFSKSNFLIPGIFRPIVNEYTYDTFESTNATSVYANQIQEVVSNLLHKMIFGKSINGSYNNTLSWQKEMQRISNEIIYRYIIPENVRNWWFPIKGNLNIEHFLINKIEEEIFLRRERSPQSNIENKDYLQFLLLLENNGIFNHANGFRLNEAATNGIQQFYN